MIGDSLLGPLFGDRAAARWGVNNQLRLPREGLLLYLGRPNLEAADVPIGDDTEIGDGTIIRWMFLLPADADIRAATGWVSGIGNIFYDSAGDPVAVLASEIVAWSSINQWNVLFHLVSADTETGRLAIYAQDTPLETLNKALKVLREDQIDVFPSASFNGMDFRLATYTGGPTYVPDHLGVLRSPGGNLPACQGLRLATTIADGAVLGTDLLNGSGDFSSSVGWNVGNWTIANGEASISNNGGTVYRLGAISGISYQVTFTIKSISSGSIKAQVGYSYGQLRTVPGTYTEILMANQVYLAVTAAAGTTAVIDNVTFIPVIPTYINTDESGNAILPSTPQKTVTYNTDWTAKTFAETFDKFDISDPLKAPGWLCEPVRTNYALNSTTPATHTTGTLAVETYTLWQEGTGSIVATAGTAVGTFGTASNGTPTTITITTAGTVVLTASGTNTWVQLELGAFKTSRIYTTAAPMVRAATIASFPTAGKIPVNNFAIRMIVVPRASGQTGYIFGSRKDESSNFALLLEPTAIQARKTSGGVNTYLQCTIPHIIDSPIDFLFVSTTNKGMQAAARAYSGSWGVFTTGGPNSMESAKADVQVGNTYRLGALEGSGSQFIGNISLFDCVPTPSGITDPMAWAKTHWGVA